MYMRNQKIFEIALKQSAIECNCNPEDFLESENKIVTAQFSKNARKYLTEPFECQFVSYGSNIVASVREDLTDVVGDYINKYPIEHCFETPNLHVLNDELQKQDLRICFMAEYFLPDVEKIKRQECPYEMRVLTQEDFRNLYVPEWGNALCEKRKELDVLGVGAYDGGKLIGLAACSADCDSMWQIGVDVLPKYRRQGIASALTSSLAVEIMERDKVPFYCAAWSNLKSVRNAIKSGFRPAWVELTAKRRTFVDEINQ